MISFTFDIHQQLGIIPSRHTQVWATRISLILSKILVPSYSQGDPIAADTYMTTRTIANKNNAIKKQERLIEFGICMPKETVQRIEAVKGPYITRGKYILKAVDKLLEQEEVLQGASDSNQERQAGRSSTTTLTKKSNKESDPIVRQQ